MAGGTVKLAGLSLAFAAGLTLGANAQPTALGDIVFERKGKAAGTPPAIFPHWVHRMRYRCYVCHPVIFEMKVGSTEITMQKLRAGESCAQCHNGRIAFGVEFQTCARCHVAPQE